MTPLRSRASVVAALAAVVLVLAAGCGVPMDREPRPISQTTVAPAATVPTTVAASDAPTVAVYFLNEDRLEARDYPVDGDAALSDALGFVLGAPPEDSSLRTSVPPDTRLRGVQVDGGLATIDLTGEVDDVSGPTQKEAFAQIVFTALGFDEVQEVSFQVDGKPIDAPTDDGNVAVISAANYEPPLNPR